MVIDTDVIIRFLTSDDTDKAARFERFLETGKEITLTDVTLAEIYWTLKSFYKFPKKKILKALEALINHSSINCHHALLTKTLQILKERNISLIDAYTAAYTKTENDSEILSYDKEFDKLCGIKRKEP